MSSPAQHLSDYLVAQAVSTAATTFFGADVPPTPSELTVVKDTPGLVPQDFMGTTDCLEQFGLQVIVRADTNAAGVTRVWAAYTLLRKITHVTISGVRYVSMVAISPPFGLGTDEAGITTGGSAGRRMWSCNFLGQRDVS